MPTKLPRCVVLRSLSVCLACTFTAGSQAADIFSLAGNVSQTPFYNAAAQEWFMPAAPFNQTTALSVTPVSDIWFINPFSDGTFEWTGNGLNQDLSADGKADGTFLSSEGGDVFRWFGDAYDQFFNPLAFPGTLLLEGTLSDFRLTESENESNFLNMTVNATFTPTGGYLLTNSDGLNLNGPYTLSLTMARAEQDTNPISDFSTGFMRTAESIQFQLTQVPEPSSLGLLLLSSLAVVRRRRA